MKKVEFKSTLFYTVLIIILSVLIIWNLFNFILGSYISIVSVLIQGVLLALLIIKHEKAKIGIQIWSAWLILTGLITTFTSVFKIMIGDEFGPHLETIIIGIITFLIAFVVNSYNHSHVRVVLIESENQDKDVL